MFALTSQIHLKIFKMLTIFNCLFSTLKTIYGQVICLIWNRRRICNTIEKNKERKCDLLDLESERYLQYD